MENAHDTLAADCTRVEARFPHRLGQPRTPPIRSTGKIVVLFENDVTGRTRTPVAKPMGGNRPRKRRCAPTSRSRSPDSVFTIPGSGVQLHRNAHVRGNPMYVATKQTILGSIPACAGKPCRRSTCRQRAWVHPRVCGETLIVWRTTRPTEGPSPRVRGNPLSMGLGFLPAGSIPACAGKPSIGRRRGRHVGVHPRVCGETVFNDAPPVDRQGPSPRVRGNLAGRGARRVAGRSIPACAGKPGPSGRTATDPRVHPRVCGETPPLRSAAAITSGPSPRVRGNR